jgi:toxin secretion/phage lysis holin
VIKSQGTDSVWTVITGGFFSSVAYLMGGVDNLLVCLAIMMVIDYITGVFIAYTNQNVSSHKAFVGIAKKITMLLFVIVANQVDLAFPNQEGQLRYYILMLLIATEGISLTENFGKMGLPVPPVWLAALESIRAKTGLNPEITDKKENDKDGKI